MRTVFILFFVMVMLYRAAAGTALPDSVPLYITPSASFSLRIPAASAADDWRPFTTAGVSCAVPSTIRNLACYLAMEAGEIPGRSGQVTVQTICFEIGVHADILRLGSRAGLNPLAGLSSMMVGMNDGEIEISSLHAFGKVENEFGFFAGVIPWYRRGHLQIELPVTVGEILSYPERFVTVNAALRIGYRVGR